jgi:hypothetical protein
MTGAAEQLDLEEWARKSARTSDPETSRMAAARAAKRMAQGRMMVLRHLMEGPKTDFELAAASGIQQTSIGKRRHDCMTDGQVEVAKDGNVVLTRPSPTGSPARVWKITQAGIDDYLNTRE